MQMAAFYLNLFLFDQIKKKFPKIKGWKKILFQSGHAKSKNKELNFYEKDL
jgi:hypothetical protein